MRKTLTTIAVVAAALAVLASPASAAVLVSHDGQGAYEGNVTGTIQHVCIAQPGVCTVSYHSYIVVMPVSVTTAEILPIVGVTCNDREKYPYGPVFAYNGARIVALGVHLTAGRFKWVAGRPYFGGTLTIAGQISGAHAAGTISLTAGHTTGTGETLGPEYCYGAHYSWTATWDPGAMPNLP